MSESSGQLEINMRCCKKTLEESDFPLKAQHTNITTRQDVPVAIAVNEPIAQAIAARLNQDAWRRLEDMWNL
jgi:hypothetical protein